MFDLVELFTHWHAGRSQVQLSESLGIDRKTIRKYLAAAIAAGLEPGGEPLSTERWAELIGGWFPQRHCQLEQSEGDFRRFASAIHQVACDV